MVKIKKDKIVDAKEDLKDAPKVGNVDLGDLLKEVEELKRQNIEDKKQLKMLTEVADKGRVFNYESQKTEKKPFKVKVSIYGEGYIVGWRTVKDELIKHPSTGAVVGETQEYELLILDAEGKTQKRNVLGYPAFSNARYNERVEAEIVSKQTDYNDNTVFTVRLPDGREISLDSRFIN